MNVALCQPCAVGFPHDAEHYEEVFENVKDGWKPLSPGYAEKLQKLTITGWEYVSTFDLDVEGRPSQEKRVYHESVCKETCEGRDPLLSL